MTVQLIIYIYMYIKYALHKSPFSFQDFSLKDYNDLVDGWEVKVVRCSDGLQGWGLFTAVKKA